MLRSVRDPDLVMREVRLPLIPWLMPPHTRFSIRRMRDDERQIGHMMLEVAARVLAVPDQVLHLVEGVLRG